MDLDRVDLAVQSGHHPDPEVEPGVPTPREVLQEFFLLLEDYAPTWYTEAHHNRALAALLGRSL